MTVEFRRVRWYWLACLALSVVQAAIIGTWPRLVPVLLCGIVTVIVLSNILRIEDEGLICSDFIGRPRSIAWDQVKWVEIDYTRREIRSGLRIELEDGETEELPAAPLQQMPPNGSNYVKRSKAI